MLHAALYGHDAPAHRAPSVPNAVGPDAGLVRALAAAGGAGDFTATDALEAIAAYAAQARRAGLPTAHVTAVVRRSFAAAAPGAMTIVAYDAHARCLVRHALYVLHTIETRGL